MPRSVNHVASKAKRTKILKQTKGYFGARKNVSLMLTATVVTRSATSALCGSSVSTLPLASTI